MNLTQTLINEGYLIEFEKGNSDNLGFDLFLKISKDDSYYEIHYSMSHELGKFFSCDFTNNFSGEGEFWDFDNNTLICEYIGVVKLIQN